MNYESVKQSHLLKIRLRQARAAFVLVLLPLAVACSNQSVPRAKHLSYAAGKAVSTNVYNSGGRYMSNVIYGIPVKIIQGETADLSEYEKKVLLIVNTASKCGYTSQYKGLEALYRRYKERGLVVLGFPCNQFMNQEPGTESEIKKFCELNYGVTFPLFSKIDVNGENTHPLYKELKRRAPGALGTESIKWNFTKFLVGPHGKTVKRFSTATKPQDIEPEMESLLPESQIAE